MFKTIALAAITSAIVLAGPQADAAHKHHFHNHGRPVPVQMTEDPIYVPPVPTQSSSQCAPGVVCPTPPPCTTKTCPNY
jgi:hypothetical protein